MNSIKDLLPGSMRERTFQLKARRDAGAVFSVHLPSKMKAAARLQLQMPKCLVPLMV